MYNKLKRINYFVIVIIFISSIFIGVLSINTQISSINENNDYRSFDNQLISGADFINVDSISGQGIPLLGRIISNTTHYYTGKIYD